VVLKAIFRLVALNNGYRSHLFTHIGESSPSFCTFFDNVLRSLVSYLLTPVTDFVECLFCTLLIMICFIIFSSSVLFFIGCVFILCAK
jgi:hypothetical protein